MYYWFGTQCPSSQLYCSISGWKQRLFLDYQCCGTNSDNISSLSPSTLYEFPGPGQIVLLLPVLTRHQAYLQHWAQSMQRAWCESVFFYRITGNSCTVGWGSISNALSYSVQYRVQLRETHGQLFPATSNSKTLTGLNASTLYEFQVQTVFVQVVRSVYSSPGIFTTTTAVSCGTHPGLNVSNLSTNGATLNWSAVSGATSIPYNIDGRYHRLDHIYREWNFTSAFRSDQ